MEQMISFLYAGSVIYNARNGSRQVNPIFRGLRTFCKNEAENHLQVGDSDDKSSEYNYYSENALGNSIVEVFVQLEKALRKINYVL